MYCYADNSKPAAGWLKCTVALHLINSRKQVDVDSPICTTLHFTHRYQRSNTRIFFNCFSMKPKTHDEFRASVCVGCHKSGVTTIVRPEKVKLIQDEVYNGFSLENTAVPFGLCNSCRGRLNRGTYVRIFEYDNLTKSIKRSNGSTCSCYICQKGRSKKRIKVKRLKPGPKTSSGDKINAAKAIKICSKCSQAIGKGIRHKCFKRLKADNLLNLATVDSTRQQIANKVVKENAKGKSTIKLKNAQGKPLQLSLGPPPKEAKKVNFDQLDRLRSKGKFSDTLMKNVVTPFIRETFGRKSIQSNYDTHMIDQTTEMKKFLEVKDIDYKDGKGSISCPTVVCPNPGNLVEHVK